MHMVGPWTHSSSSYLNHGYNRQQFYNNNTRVITLHPYMSKPSVSRINVKISKDRNFMRNQYCNWCLQKDKYRYTHTHVCLCKKNTSKIILRYFSNVSNKRIIEHQQRVNGSLNKIILFYYYYCFIKIILFYYKNMILLLKWLLVFRGE